MRSGFSKSLAILASSLFGAIPMLTVKPSCSLTVLEIRWLRQSEIQLIGDRCKVQKTFINGKLFNVRCKRTQKRHKLLGILTVHRMIRTCDNQGFTFSKSMCDRFAGFDTKRFCRSRLCQYDPVTALAVSADNGGIVRRSTVLPFFSCSMAVQLKKAEFTSI